MNFTQCDVNQVASDQGFDAAVGRFILEFLPDPAAVLRSLLVHPAGILAFQAPCWAPILAISTHLPLLVGRRLSDVRNRVSLRS